MLNENRIFREIIDFIQGKETLALIKGNSNNNALSIIFSALLVCFYGENRNILFRTNCVAGLEKHLSQALSGFWNGDPKSIQFIKRIRKSVKNRGFSIGSINIFIDTINSRSQFTTPYNIHTTLLYPAEEFLSNNTFEKTLSDLFLRKTGKIIFCSSKSHKNLNKLKKLTPIIIDYKIQDLPDIKIIEDELCLLRS